MNVVPSPWLPFWAVSPSGNIAAGGLFGLTLGAYYFIFKPGARNLLITEKRSFCLCIAIGATLGMMGSVVELGLPEWFQVLAAAYAFSWVGDFGLQKSYARTIEGIMEERSLAVDNVMSHINTMEQFVVYKKRKGERR